MDILNSTQAVPELEPEDMERLQREDPSLETVRKAADQETSSNRASFIKKNGILYRVCAHRKEKASAREQLVLPNKYRKLVLELAHSIPLAGHLGKHITMDRILQRFYWPTARSDVADYCKRCVTCQKTSRVKPPRAPLIPFPVMGVPFERIAMDIVGPLPRTSSGNKYILVILDYATRYPEAIAMKSVEAEKVAEELMNMFARVGIPGEILTDQGSNFTSQLLAELYRMLRVKPIKTTPYHPQTDGLVERFNQTLKSMLRRVSVQGGTDWDKLLPYVLFAYREVAQSSTGFSPFELLYGREVRGPLDV